VISSYQCSVTLKSGLRPLSSTSHRASWEC